MASTKVPIELSSTPGIVDNSNATAITIDSSENVGIGTSSPAVKTHIAASSYTSPTGGLDPNIKLLINNSQYCGMQILGSSTGSSFIHFGDQDNADVGLITYEHNGDYMRFDVNASERMRIDSSGNVLVSTTSSNYAVAGSQLGVGGNNYMTRSGAQPLLLNRLSSDGDVLLFMKDGSPVGSIGTSGGDIYIDSVSGGVGILANAGTGNYGWTSSFIYPTVDDARDLGTAVFRFDDVYASNGTIQTSDRNEKQDIEELSEAETRVAVAAKGLLKKYRWKSAVEEKGDEARIHFGIIAQDLQDAFTAEGLDASRYAMFTSNTWTDEETGEEKTRLGVRYHELLAFIIAGI